MHRKSIKGAAFLAAAIAASLTPAAAIADSGEYFERVATYPVYQNHPDGAAATTAAEISTV